LGAVRVFYPERSSRASAADRETPSCNAARCHGLGFGRARGLAAAVSARNRSSVATTAAASLAEAGSVSSSMLGLGGRRSPFLAMSAI
jgi:hypothetical protein